MSNDFPMVGFGVGTVIIMFLIYVAVMLVAIWIFYVIVRAAVTNGILRASRRGAFQNMVSPPAYPPQHTMNPNAPSGQAGPPYQT